MNDFLPLLSGLAGGYIKGATLRGQRLAKEKALALQDARNKATDKYREDTLKLRSDEIGQRAGIHISDQIQKDFNDIQTDISRFEENSNRGLFPTRDMAQGALSNLQANIYNRLSGMQMRYGARELEKTLGIPFATYALSKINSNYLPNQFDKTPLFGGTEKPTWTSDFPYTVKPSGGGSDAQAKWWEAFRKAREDASKRNPYAQQSFWAQVAPSLLSQGRMAGFTGEDLKSAAPMLFPYQVAPLPTTYNVTGEGKNTKAVLPQFENLIRPDVLQKAGITDLNQLTDQQAVKAAVDAYKGLYPSDTEYPKTIDAYLADASIKSPMRSLYQTVPQEDLYAARTDATQAQARITEARRAGVELDNIFKSETLPSRIEFTALKPLLAMSGNWLNRLRTESSVRLQGILGDVASGKLTLEQKKFAILQVPELLKNIASGFETSIANADQTATESAKLLQSYEVQYGGESNYKIFKSLFRKQLRGSTLTPEEKITFESLKTDYTSVFDQMTNYVNAIKRRNESVNSRGQVLDVLGGTLGKELNTSFLDIPNAYPGYDSTVTRELADDINVGKPVTPVPPVPGAQTIPNIGRNAPTSQTAPPSIKVTFPTPLNIPKPSAGVLKPGATKADAIVLELSSNGKPPARPRPISPSKKQPANPQAVKKPKGRTDDDILRDLQL